MTLLLVGGVSYPCASSALAQDDLPSKLTTWQQIVLVVAGKLDNAAEACGYMKREPAVEALLRSADLDPVRAKKMLFNEVRRQIDDDRAKYVTDRDAACAFALNTYGADGAPGVRDLLVQP